MSGLRERLEALADEFARDAANAQVGARNAGEADDGVALAVWESERLTYRDVERRVRALLAEDETPGDGQPMPTAEKELLLTDSELDALVQAIRDAERGGCGSHQGCRDLVAKKKRDAARRWFIDYLRVFPPGRGRDAAKDGAS